jgi:hypothetical protein
MGDELDFLVRVWARLDRSWFRTKTRARMPDGDRMRAKDRRIMRGVRLASYWLMRARSESKEKAGS